MTSRVNRLIAAATSSVVLLAACSSGSAFPIGLGSGETGQPTGIMPSAQTQPVGALTPEGTVDAFSADLAEALKAPQPDGEAALAALNLLTPDAQAAVKQQSPRSTADGLALLSGVTTAPESLVPAMTVDGSASAATVVTRWGYGSGAVSRVFDLERGQDGWRIADIRTERLNPRVALA